MTQTECMHYVVVGETSLNAPPIRTSQIDGPRRIHIYLYIRTYHHSSGNSVVDSSNNYKRKFFQVAPTITERVFSLL